jgi:hypothetical protein
VSEAFPRLRVGLVALGCEWQFKAVDRFATLAGDFDVLVARHNCCVQARPANHAFLKKLGEKPPFDSRAGILVDQANRVKIVDGLVCDDSIGTARGSPPPLSETKEISSQGTCEETAIWGTVSSR